MADESNLCRRCQKLPAMRDRKDGLCWDCAKKEGHITVAGLLDKALSFGDKMKSMKFGWEREK